MSETVLAFPQRVRGPYPWTADELVELNRVVDILARAGLATETDMGVSDEGDPWFVFCRADTGDVIAHFARVGGQFVAASVAIDTAYKGANFRDIVDRMVRSQPIVLPPRGPGTRLLLHPAVILTAFVATALAHSDKALAANTLRPVETKWDVHHDGAPAAGHAGGMTSWFDPPASLMSNPIAEAAGHHDGASTGQGISLASLISIAMTAMQPVVEKLSFISQTSAPEPVVYLGSDVHRGTVDAAVSDFVNSGAYDIAGPVQLSMSLDKELAQYADPSHPLKVVVFESNGPKPEIFGVAPGVVLVDERHFVNLGQTAVSPAGHVLFDIGSSGNNLTLIGVATIDINHPTA